jgi:hypothetical protein
MRKIAIDFELLDQTCSCCDAPFQVSRGGVYEDGQPIGLYLAAMHGCDQRMALLAIAVQTDPQNPEETTSIALDVWSTDTEIQMSVTDPEESPWREEQYLGPMLTREKALASPLLPTFFAIADEIALQDPVSSFLNS